MVSGEKCATYSRTSLLKGFLLLPRNSPIICRLRPFLCSRKWATPMGVSGMKPREIRNWRPLSGFLRTRKRRDRVCETKSLQCRDAILQFVLNCGCDWQMICWQLGTIISPFVLANSECDLQTAAPKLYPLFSIIYYNGRWAAIKHSSNTNKWYIASISLKI